MCDGFNIYKRKVLMPEWCLNGLVIEGNEIQDCLDYCIRPDDDGQLELDFNAVIPMPKVLENTTVGDMSDWLSTIKSHANRLLHDYLASEAAGSENDELSGSLQEYAEKAKEFKQQAMDAFKQNPPDWYIWRLINWNTKWNASGTAVEYVNSETATINFATAWSPPLGIILALSQRFPEMQFTLTYEEPQVGFRGRYLCSGGKEIINECEENWHGNKTRTRSWMMRAYLKKKLLSSTFAVF